MESNYIFNEKTEYTGSHITDEMIDWNKITKWANERYGMSFVKIEMNGKDDKYDFTSWYRLYTEEGKYIMLTVRHYNKVFLGKHTAEMTITTHSGDKVMKITTEK